MKKLEKIEYTIKAAIGGASTGLAGAGGLSFIPSVTMTFSIVSLLSLFSAIAFSCYVYNEI